MKLSRAQIQYLLMIYDMLERGPVRLRDIAEAMQVSKPSVHGMEEQFVRLGLLDKRRYMPIQMTAEGKRVVKEYQKQLYVLSGHLEKSLYLPIAVAKESAFILLGEWSEEYRNRVFLYLSQSQ